MQIVFVFLTMNQWATKKTSEAKGKQPTFLQNGSVSIRNDEELGSANDVLLVKLDTRNDTVD